VSGDALSQPGDLARRVLRMERPARPIRPFTAGTRRRRGHRLRHHDRCVGRRDPFAALRAGRRLIRHRARAYPPASDGLNGFPPSRLRFFDFGYGNRSGEMIREELTRLFTVEERHRRLLARLLIAAGLTVVVAVAGAVLVYVFESGKKGGDVHGFGDAVFFTLVQLLTVSSSFKNPVTTAGKVVDVALEAWAIFVISAIAGSFASFFTSGDSS
jgi:hypothetical protein